MKLNFPIEPLNDGTARFAYKIYGEHPHVCTIISDEPVFYVSFDEGEADILREEIKKIQSLEDTPSTNAKTLFRSCADSACGGVL